MKTPQNLSHSRGMLKVFAICALAVPGFSAFAEKIHVSTPATSLVLDAEKGNGVKFLYYGSALNPSELDAIGDSGTKQHDAYPFYGNFPQGESAMALTHADGNMTLDMVVEDVSKTTDNGAEITTVTMRDKVYPVTVRLNYKTYPGEDVIETWTETVNGENKPITLTQFSSGYLP